MAGTSQLEDHFKGMSGETAKMDKVRQYKES